LNESILHYIFSNLYITRNPYGLRVNKCRKVYGLRGRLKKKKVIPEPKLNFYRQKIYSK